MLVEDVMPSGRQFVRVAILNRSLDGPFMSGALNEIGSGSESI